MIPDYLTAQRLIGEADAILATSRDATFHMVAQRKAVEISDFLQSNGQQMDAEGNGHLVDQLGMRVDALATGVSATLGDVQQSPLAAGVKGFFSGSGDSFKDFYQNLGVVGKWAVAGIGGLVLLRIFSLFKR